MVLSVLRFEPNTSVRYEDGLPSKQLQPYGPVKAAGPCTVEAHGAARVNEQRAAVLGLYEDVAVLKDDVVVFHTPIYLREPITFHETNIKIGKIIA